MQLENITNSSSYTPHYNEKYMYIYSYMSLPPLLEGTPSSLSSSSSRKHTECSASKPNEDMTSRGMSSSVRRLASLRSHGAASRLMSSRQAGPSAQLPRHLLLPLRRSSSNSRNPKPSTDLAAAATTNEPAVADDHLALAKPLDFDMASKIDGQESQMVSFELEPGQVIRVRYIESMSVFVGVGASAE